MLPPSDVRCIGTCRVAFNTQTVMAPAGGEGHGLGYRVERHPPGVTLPFCAVAVFS